ncbi:MAG: hypothetical protein Ct9H300mP23_03480 [Nitrospinota bacterium]|nr:MAG: hypothetical protein Ct9H300mP23_03480 [Nitrospinota bacterium]
MKKNRLWFYGRKNQRVITGVKTLFTIPCEAIFNQHPDVKRSALVGIGLRTKTGAGNSYRTYKPQRIKIIRGSK